jgi:hypothetical protein
VGVGGLQYVLLMLLLLLQAVGGGCLPRFFLLLGIRGLSAWVVAGAGAGAVRKCARAHAMSFLDDEAGDVARNRCRCRLTI